MKVEMTIFCALASFVFVFFLCVCVLGCLFFCSFKSLCNILEADGREGVKVSGDAGCVLSRVGELFLIELMQW